MSVKEAIDTLQDYCMRMCGKCNFCAFYEPSREFRCLLGGRIDEIELEGLPDKNIRRAE